MDVTHAMAVMAVMAVMYVTHRMSRIHGIRGMEMNEEMHEGICETRAEIETCVGMRVGIEMRVGMMRACEMETCEKGLGKSTTPSITIEAVPPSKFKIARKRSSGQ
jgi:hypothetical protein